jgi:hypothetical protein
MLFPDCHDGDKMRSLYMRRWRDGGRYGRVDGSSQRHLSTRKKDD